MFRRSSLFHIAKRSCTTAINIQPILFNLSKQFNKTPTDKPLENVLVVAMQHLLGTTVDLFKVWKELGLSDAVIGGKSYSTHLESAEDLRSLGFQVINPPKHSMLRYGLGHQNLSLTTQAIWVEACEKLKKNRYELVIILDDGGHLLLNMPLATLMGQKLLGIEQTQNGLNYSVLSLPLCIINVAQSYLKELIEYPQIAQITVDKIIKIINQPEIELQNGNFNLPEKIRIGIVGYGRMGKAIAAQLALQKFKVIIYDEEIKTDQNALHLKFCQSIGQLFEQSNVIIGCTGKDITQLKTALAILLESNTPKLLISTSSQDIEFLSLIQHKGSQLFINQKFNQKSHNNPHQTIFYKNLCLLNGGFPINFNRTKHSVSPKHIWPTRAMLSSALLSGVNLAYYEYSGLEIEHGNVRGLLKLDPYHQLLIFKEYQALNPNESCLDALNNLSDTEILEKINKNSKGENITLGDFSEEYSNTGFTKFNLGIT